MAENKFHEPTEIEKKFDNFSDRLMPILVPILSLIGDVAVLYTIYYFFSVGMPYAWLWSVLVLAITVPILYIFNKASIDFIKNGFRKNKKKE